MKAFDNIGVDYQVVVEPQQFDNYAEYIPVDRLICLPHQDRGLVVTRNWVWDYAQAQGYEKFWTFDDNIESFWRFNHNSKARIRTPNFLSAIEDWAGRYQNVPIIGMHYYMFIKSRYNKSNEGRPVSFNTRVYSNMLIETAAPFRNRGFFNDDTDLCLQALSAGYCTALFNAFLVKKRVTMSQTGGMTPYYMDDGRYKMARELADRWPGLVKITKRWGRYQHYVDYRPFRGNKLIRKPGVVIPPGTNDYGMFLGNRRR